VSIGFLFIAFAFMPELIGTCAYLLLISASFQGHVSAMDVGFAKCRDEVDAYSITDERFMLALWSKLLGQLARAAVCLIAILLF
jgi:hypothetical protein